MVGVTIIEPKRKNLNKNSIVPSLNSPPEYKNATPSCQKEAHKRNRKIIFDRLLFLNKTRIVIPIHKGIKDNKLKKIKNMYQDPPMHLIIIDKYYFHYSHG